MLPAVVGAQEAYVNGCIAGLIYTQIAISKQCGENLGFRPNFLPFENMLGGPSKEDVTAKNDAVYNHC